MQNIRFVYVSDAIVDRRTVISVETMQSVVG